MSGPRIRFVHTGRGRAHQPFFFSFLAQEELIDKYGYLANWARQCNEAVADAVLNMERQVVAVTFKVLSVLKPLVMPDARAKALAVMNGDNLSYGSFLRKILEIEDAMWTDWHWHQAPDDVIHPDKSVPHCSLTNQSLFRRTQCYPPLLFFSVHSSGWPRPRPTNPHCLCSSGQALRSRYARGCQ